MPAAVVVVREATIERGTNGHSFISCLPGLVGPTKSSLIALLPKNSHGKQLVPAKHGVVLWTRIHMSSTLILTMALNAFITRSSLLADLPKPDEYDGRLSRCFAP